MHACAIVESLLFVTTSRARQHCSLCGSSLPARAAVEAALLETPKASVSKAAWRFAQQKSRRFSLAVEHQSCKLEVACSIQATGIFCFLFVFVLLCLSCAARAVSCCICRNCGQGEKSRFRVTKQLISRCNIIFNVRTRFQINLCCLTAK